MQSDQRRCAVGGFFTSSRKNWFTAPSACRSVPLISLAASMGLYCELLALQSAFWGSSGGKWVYTRYIGTLDDRYHGLLLKDLEAQRARAAEANRSGVM